MANAVVGAVAADEDRVHRRLSSPLSLGPMARCPRYPGRTPRRRRRTPCRGRRRPSPFATGLGPVAAIRGSPRGERPGRGSSGRGRAGHARPSPSWSRRRSERSVRRGAVRWTVPFSSSPPVELVGLARIEAERHVAYCRGFGLRPRPSSRIPAHGIMAAAKSQGPEFLEDPDGSQALQGAASLCGLELFQRPLRSRFWARRTRPICSCPTTPGARPALASTRSRLAFSPNRRWVSFSSIVRALPANQPRRLHCCLSRRHTPVSVQPVIECKHDHRMAIDGAVRGFGGDPA